MVRECSRIRGAEQRQIFYKACGQSSKARRREKKPRHPPGQRGRTVRLPVLFRRAHFLDLHVVRASTRMLPLLISVLTIPISLDMAILPGLSGMFAIVALVLAMFSPEHAVAALVFAEAGVKARAENTAAMIRIFIGPPWE
jgi:hypothetical protein